jgi:hypothetical protein
MTSIIQNKIISNIFTQSEIEDIYSAVDAVSEKTQVQEFLGRIRIDYEADSIHKLPDSIKNKVSSIAKQISDIHSLFYFTYVEYNNSYGMPKLGPHKDETSFSLTINCQLESNTEWDLYVEGIPYKLEDNSALIMNVRDQDHWRPEKSFKEGEFIRMLFFHFNDPNDEELNVVTEQQLKEINDKWKHLS